MPRIQSSTDLRNNYNDISTFCNESNEPVFITKNGRGDLAVMSIALYDQLIHKNELYRLLQEAEADFKAGREMTFEESFQKLRKGLENGTI
ncbi:MAG: type II toxin-antitoxin system prevent-host-death family antitoxin [Clostridiaceae bacterium]|jgi:prevent-host-death family protein|nr:type II toxin-antitoxin system prevent-host-death family antitoxin [Clostridiaceae bacterium]